MALAIGGEFRSRLTSLVKCNLISARNSCILVGARLRSMAYLSILPVARVEPPRRNRGCGGTVEVVTSRGALEVPRGLLACLAESSWGNAGDRLVGV